VVASGEIAGYDTRILVLSAMKGFFGARSSDQVTYVNAPQLAAAAGVTVKETKTSSDAGHADWVNLLTLRAGRHCIAATLVGPRRRARIVLVDDHITDVPPADHMIVVRNDDRPGVIGSVGTLLGRHDVNIADMDVGQAIEPGTALMVIVPTADVSETVLDELRALPGIIEVTSLRG
jgi:D-3-phosphoglycerate dehydrogenase